MKFPASSIETVALLLAAALAAGNALAQAPTPQACLHPASEAAAKACDDSYRFCTKPPNEEWKQKWRTLCAARSSGAAAPGTGAAYSGTATVTSTARRTAIKAVAQVSWQPKAGSRTTFVPSGTLAVSGTSGDCSGTETVTLGPEDGELEVKLGADGKPAQYRGVGMKTMSIKVVCPKARGAGVMPVAWFSTTEEFRAINAGRLEGKWSDPEGSWTWEWKFTP
jgi:hypothetical protein